MPSPDTDLHVYWANPHRSHAVRHLLDDVELERLASLRKPDDQARYVASHALARLVVARHAGIEDARVVFNRTCPICGGPHGKPHVGRDRAEREGDVPTWHVSLSHAADVVLVAITTAGPVGVDVEALEGSGFEGFAEVALSRSETLELQRFPAVRRQRAQATWWTRKEAVLKATGHGLTVPPKRIVVTAPDLPPALLRWKGDGAPTDPVTLWDLDLGSAYAASVATISQEVPELKVHRGNDLLAEAATRAPADPG